MDRGCSPTPGPTSCTGELDRVGRKTNGKVERFHRTLADEWAYVRLYSSDVECCTEFTTWLHTPGNQVSRCIDNTA